MKNGDTVTAEEICRDRFGKEVWGRQIKGEVIMGVVAIKTKSGEVIHAGNFRNVKKILKEEL